MFTVTNLGTVSKRGSFAVTPFFNPYSSRKVPTDLDSVCCESSEATSNNSTTFQSFSNRS